MGVEPHGSSDHRSRPLLAAVTDVLARHRVFLTAVVTAAAFAVHVRDALLLNKHSDLFIHMTGAAFGPRLGTPYDTAATREMVAGQYPDDPELAANCGFFLPPQGVLVMAPFAAVPWPAAKWLWAVGTFALAGVAVYRLPVFAAGPAPAWLPPVLAAGVLLNPAVVTGMLPAQTSVPTFALIVLGEVAARRGWTRLAGLLWAVPFVKPHLALPLLPLAWYLGGWRRAAWVVFWLAVLNLAGAAVCGRGPGLMADYLRYLAAAHKGVIYNLAEFNPQITSWNRLVIAAGGPVVELSAPAVLAGYAVWAGLVLGRVWVAGTRPTRAWAVAAAATGALVCCQLLGYELILFALAVPHALDLAAAGRWKTAALVLLWMVYVSLPFGVMEKAVGLVHPDPGFGWKELPEHPSAGWRAAAVVLSHRAVGVALLAATVLVGGWPRVSRPGPRPG